MSGTAYNTIVNDLKDFPPFANFRKGILDRKLYAQQVVKLMNSLTDTSLNEDMLNLSARIPLDEEVYVDELLMKLHKSGAIPRTEYDKELFDTYREKVDKEFIHGGNATYIFPEEARTIFALADIVKPEKVAFMGSYYAYWAIWILPVLLDKSEIWLMDIDEECQALAYENMQLFSDAKRIDIHFETTDAIEAVKNIDRLDLVVLDAEGPREGPIDPDLIDKAIYYPMMKAAYPALKPGGLMLAHNVLLENTTDTKYIDDKIEWNLRMFTRFLPFVRDKFRLFHNFESTEGLGVASK